VSTAGVDVGGHGGSEKRLCKQQTYRPFTHFALLKTKGPIVGQKRPLKPKHAWAIGVRLELAENHCDLALFNMAIDRKLSGLR
jgi:hypothetical protein